MVNQKQSKIVRFFTSGSFREIVVLLLIVFVIRTFGFGLYQVPTGSMETTMLVGERFFADKFTLLFSKPQRGNIIAFNDPRYKYSDNRLRRLFQEYVWGPDNLTKRIIGLPGDHIKGVIEEGKPVIYVNDKKLDEPYINKYPIIGVWPDDPLKLYAQAKRQALTSAPARGMYPFSVDAFITQILARQINFKSFDPDKPYNQQPFYRINEHHITRISQENNSFIIAQEGELLIKYPGIPEQPVYAVGKTEGKNYWNGSDEFYIELDDHHYWVMGDNRRGSADSRFFGPINGRLIHGKILLRIWSLDSKESWWIMDLIKHPIDFFTRMRWGRFFQRL